MVKDATPTIVVDGKAVSDGETGDDDVRGEIFKHAERGVAADRQIAGTGPIDGHPVGDLKFAACQRDGAEDLRGVDCVTVIGHGERVAQRTGAAIFSACDYND